MARAVDEIEEITRRRRAKARDLGFEFAEVEIIGNEWEIDLEQLKKLIAEGCRPMTALRILR